MKVSHKKKLEAHLSASCYEIYLTYEAYINLMQFFFVPI